MRNNICPKCNSPEIIPNVEIRDYNASSYRPLSVAVKPARVSGSLVNKSAESGEMRAWICGHCGFTEIYTLGFTELSLD